jgi:alkylated DNA repair protein alkB family protein 6
VNDSTSKSSGKAIAAVPLARLYLEPRSLLILSSSLYASHLHGISETTRDILTAPTSTAPSSDTNDEDASNASVPVANLHLLDPSIQETIARDGRFESERGTRVSLTFRKVERVMKGALGGGGGKMGLFGKR